MIPSEQLAQKFHEAYERLAPQFGYETRKESSVPWDQVPERNRKLMVAVCAELLASYVQERVDAEVLAEAEWWSANGANENEVVWKPRLDKLRAKREKAASGQGESQ